MVVHLRIMSTRFSGRLTAAALTLVLALTLAACGSEPSPSAQARAVELPPPMRTATPAPTETRIPLPSTQTPTETPFSPTPAPPPTQTPIPPIPTKTPPTETPIPLSPTQTLTETPIPPTPTAPPTKTPIPPIPTRTPTNTPIPPSPTRTPPPTPAPAPSATKESGSLIVLDGGGARPAVSVGGAAFDVEIAFTPDDRMCGLSGRDGLAAGAGMLFVFENGRASSFWMRDMRFALDFVWIGDGCEVIEIHADVPAPPAGTDVGLLPTYSSAAARYNLEINAGEAAKRGVEVGDAVKFIGFSGEGATCQ